MSLTDSGQILQIAGNIELHKAGGDGDEELFGEEQSPSTSHQLYVCLLSGNISVVPRLLEMVTAPSRHKMTCWDVSTLHSTCPRIGPVKDTRGAKYFCLPELLLFSGPGSEPPGLARR